MPRLPRAIAPSLRRTTDDELKGWRVASREGPGQVGVMRQPMRPALGNVDAPAGLTRFASSASIC